MADDSSSSSSDNGHSGGGGSFKINTQLTGTSNYELWIDDLKVLLEEKDCLEHAFEQPPKPTVGELKPRANNLAPAIVYTKKDLKKWKRNEVKTKRSIRNNCKPTALQRLTGVETSKDMLSRLQQSYGLMGFTIIQGFLSVLSKLDDADNPTFEETIAQFIEANSGLMKMGVPLGNTHQITYFLSAFSSNYPEWYNRKRSEITKALEATREGTNVKHLSDDVLKDLIRDLTDHATKNPAIKKPPAQANRTFSTPFNQANPNNRATEGREVRGNDTGRKFRTWRDHFEGDGCTLKCQYCIKTLGRMGHGHVMEECVQKDPSKKRPQVRGGSYIPKPSGANEDDVRKFNHVNQVKEEPGLDEPRKRQKTVALSQVLFTSNTDRDKDLWQYDTCANIHICNNRSLFTSFDPDNSSLPYISTVAGFILPCGLGTVSVLTKQSDGRCHELELRNVYYIPEAPTNLMSGNKLREAGIFNCQRTDTLRRYENDSEVAKILVANETWYISLHQDHTDLLEREKRKLAITGENQDLNVQHS